MSTKWFWAYPQTNQLSLGIENAYKFNSENSLDIFEDWIGGFKVIDETQDGLCTIISEQCPDVNHDGHLTQNAEFCIGSYYWNGDNGNTGYFYMVLMVIHLGI